MPRFRPDISGSRAGFRKRLSSSTGLAVGRTARPTIFVFQLGVLLAIVAAESWQAVAFAALVALEGPAGTPSPWGCARLFAFGHFLDVDHFHYGDGIDQPHLVTQRYFPSRKRRFLVNRLRNKRRRSER